MEFGSASPKSDGPRSITGRSNVGRPMQPTPLKGDDPMGFQVYTRFGRVLATFWIGDNELHHHALERARKFLLSQERAGTTCWSRVVRR
jgi:hypothetical protein